MKAKNWSNTIRLLLATHLVVGGFVAFYQLPEHSVLIRWASLLGALILGIAVGILSDSGKAFIVYIRASISEAQKVVWPNRQESLRLTLLVFVFVLALSLFMWATDSFLFWVFNDLLLRRG